MRARPSPVKATIPKTGSRARQVDLEYLGYGNPKEGHGQEPGGPLMSEDPQHHEE